MSRNESILKIIAATISVDDAKYEAATNRYKSISEWITRDASDIRFMSPSIYTHGSFALGTAINPLYSSNSDYDLDIMCCLNSETTNSITQSQLKTLVGKEIKAYARQYNMDTPEDHNRAWTINYSEQSRFHIDIIPAIPKANNERDTNVFIPYKKSAFYSSIVNPWDKQSNPKGFVEWFKDQMKEDFEEKRRYYANNAKITIEKVPDYSVRTVLQEIVILLKRHRDVFFDKCDDAYIKDAPVASIIISTLVGRAYNKQKNLADAFISAVNSLENGMCEKYANNSIQFAVNEAYDCGNKLYIITNPANPSENFADKWREHPYRKAAFFKWIKKLKLDCIILEKFLNSETTDMTIIKDMFGENILTVAAHSIDKEIQHNESKYLQALKYPKNISGIVNIKGYCARKELGNVYGFELAQYSINSNEPLSIKKHLLFVAETNLQEPYSVLWQISNRGPQAIRENCLRGEIEEGTKKVCGHKSRYQKDEVTSFIGTHWIKCYVISPNGQCLAESTRFYVNIGE